MPEILRPSSDGLEEGRIHESWSASARQAARDAKDRAGKLLNDVQKYYKAARIYYRLIKKANTQEPSSQLVQKSILVKKRQASVARQIKKATNL